MTSLLFVDDESNVLDGLRRLFRSERKGWEMAFASSGHEALELLQHRRFDVVVSDMRMPGMDGAELLQHVATICPGTVRIVLSGQSERERIVRALATAHQYLSKPCDPELLRRTVAQAVRLRDRLPSTPLKRAVSTVVRVPSAPESYAALVEQFASETPDLATVAEIVASDIGMTAKVLQVVSTSFFGRPQRVRSAVQAVEILGLETIGEMLGSGSAFAAFDESSVPGIDMSERNRHAIEVAECARRIVSAETEDPQTRADAYLAGMLHDVGQIVLATQFPDEYQKAIRSAAENRIPLWMAEHDAFNAGHADIGSYLMGLWGLPEPIIEAICHFRSPEAVGTGFGLPLQAVHRANGFWQCLIEVGDA
ncbi:MAG TPA: HDOD domain-containing protein [Pirellulaceae bacterium]|nr:HDOD domain-containing protein [Pirellulaceae bacterium]